MKRERTLEQYHGTTILGVKKGGRTVIAGDGQVSLGNTVIKPNAKKVRRLGDGSVIGGFAGATADAFTLFERLEKKLEAHRGQLLRDDLAVWAEHPVFGVGPGRASEERGSELGGAAAHTEYTRALAEHGLFGLASVAILAGMTWRRLTAAVEPAEKALLAALFLWALLFMGVNSMRLAAPSLLFGLAFAHWAPAPSPASALPEASTSRRSPFRTGRAPFGKSS